MFFKDSTLWFGDNLNDIDSIRFSSTDFVNTKIPVYGGDPIESGLSFSNVIEYGLMLLLFPGLVFFLWKRRVQPANMGGESLPAKRIMDQLLDEREVLLLTQISSNPDPPGKEYRDPEKAPQR